MTGNHTTNPRTRPVTPKRNGMSTRTLRSSILILTVAALLVGGAAASAAPPTAAPPTAPAAVSPPHIVPQANGLTGHRFAPEANRTVPYAASSDGCNHDYGEPDQCVPLHSPASFHGSKNKQFDCAYLTAEGWFSKPLLVRNDSQNVLPRHQAANKAKHTPEGWFLTGCVDG